MNGKDTLNQIRENKLKFVSLRFTDMTGVVKRVDMPSNGIEGALEDGVWFDGPSVEGFVRIQESDMQPASDFGTHALIPSR